jgi:thiol:disulfide interchange protein DsbD
MRAAVIVIGAMMAGRVGAQVERPIHWTATARTTSVSPGDSVRVVLRATIQEYFHMYSTTQGPGGPVRTTIALPKLQGWSRIGDLRVPPPDTIPDANFGIMSEVYDDSVSVGLTLRLAEGVDRIGTPSIAVTYQACTTRYCLPARTDTVSVPIRLAANTKAIDPPAPTVGAPTVGAPSVAAPSVAAREIETFGQSGGMGAFLLLAASTGLLALLTPCVFPMIPLTVTSFLAGANERRQGVRQAGLYALGIIAAFTALGVLTSAIFGAAGLARFSAHPVVNLVIAGLFLLFALSLLGVVTPRLPSRLTTHLSTLRNPMAMGVLFTMTAFTCTAPFIGALLVMSSQGTWEWPLTGTLVFATAFASPFFVLALVPGALRRRPRAGEWMPTLEQFVAAVEIAAAIKFASNADLVAQTHLLTRTRMIGLWMVVFVILAAFFITRGSRVRLVAAGIALALVAVLARGLGGKRLGELEAFLPPATMASESSWLLNDIGGAMEIARRQARPILVDFTGYTCTNCRWMEANMFTRDDIRTAMGGYVRVRLYTDGVGETYQSQQRLEERLFGTVALPLYAVLDPTGTPRAKFLGMTRDAAEFTRFLSDGARP